MRVGIIIPVAPFEPLNLLIASAKHLRSLDFGDMEVKILYVIDSNEDEKVATLRQYADVLARGTSRGKRAGAINDGVAYFATFKPDYIAIFDVDSRPEKDFIIKCVEALESDGKAYIASTRRYISNPINLVSKTVEAEYYLINFLLRKSGFRQFNGLIGVLKASLLEKYGLNENALAEDADFATRMHAMGYTALLCDGKIYEQAPVTWKDLYNQRKRWYYGGLQLWKYAKAVFSSRQSRFISSWLMALTLTYIPALFIPLILLLSPPLLLYKFRKVDRLPVVLGLIIHALLLQLASITALVSFVTGRDMRWAPMKRTEG